MSYLVTFAVVSAALGAAVWIRGRRKGDRLARLSALFGISGVYIAGLASVGGRAGLTVRAGPIIRSVPSG
jgi:hypothetical protein